MKSFSGTKILALTGLAAAAALFAVNPAQAFSFYNITNGDYDWAFSGLPGSSGQMTAVDGTITAFTGTWSNVPITNFLYEGPTQKISFDPYSGETAKIKLPFPIEVVIDIDCNTGGSWYVFGLRNCSWSVFKWTFIGDPKPKDEYSQLPGDFTIAAVPEPLTILGSITAVGFGCAFKRKKNAVNKN